jgi:two-component system, OmpR family, response regulator
MALRILLVDDDDNLREVVRYALSREGYEIEEATNGVAALERASGARFDLIVLDVLMPELDGLEVCKRLRRTSDVPILFLSSRGEELDKVLGLEMGGDDYVAKPFSTRELVSRVKAILRRAQPRSPTLPTAGGVRMDPTSHRAWVGDGALELTVTEFRMLLALVERPDQVFTRAQLVRSAYDDNHHVSDRTVDSHMRHIRKKLRELDCDPVETVHGLGYRLRR